MSESVLSIRVGNHPRVSFNRGEGEILDLAQALNLNKSMLGLQPLALTGSDVCLGQLLMLTCFV